MKNMVIVGVLCVIAVATADVFALDFVAGHFYAQAPIGGEILCEYDLSGRLIDSFRLDTLQIGCDFRGLAFGSDDLLYLVNNLGSFHGFEVLAINSECQVQQRYQSNVDLGQHASLGKIAFDQDDHFYVGTSSQIVQFDIGVPTSARRFGGSNVFDVDVMPNGHVVNTGDSFITEFDEADSPFRSLYGDFSNSRGFEYDPKGSVFYVSSSGPSGDPVLFDALEKIDASTGQPLGRTTFTYCDDLWLALDGRLVVGSRTEAPGIFDSDLTRIGSFEGDAMMFVTQFVPVPEPPSLVLLGIAAISVATRILRRQKQ